MNIQNVFHKVCNESVIFMKRNSSTILSCVGALGVVGTAVTASQAGTKAAKLLEEAKQDKGEDLTKIEVVKVAGPVYITPILLGTSTIACILGANILNKRQQAALISAYALLDNSYKDYKLKVQELYGEDANIKVKQEIAKDNYEEEDIELDDGKQLFYDELGQRYFESTIEDVQKAEYYINRDIHMRGWAELNEFYEYLDIEQIPGGEALGWSEGGNLAHYWQAWVDFNHHKVELEDGLECIILTMFQEPYVNWESY